MWVLLGHSHACLHTVGQVVVVVVVVVVGVEGCHLTAVLAVAITSSSSLCHCHYRGAAGQPTPPQGGMEAATATVAVAAVVGAVDRDTQAGNDGNNNNNSNNNNNEAQCRKGIKARLSLAVPPLPVHPPTRGCLHPPVYRRRDRKKKGRKEKAVEAGSPTPISLLGSCPPLEIAGVG